MLFYKMSNLRKYPEANILRFKTDLKIFFSNYSQLHEEI